MNSAATTPQTTIACTLSAGDYRDRLKHIAGLARDSLRSHDRNGLVLTLRYDASAADRVKEMVRREQECCPFLNIAVREETHQIVVSVTAPEEAGVGHAARLAGIGLAPIRGATDPKF